MEREGLIRSSSPSTHTNAWLTGTAVTEREINQHCSGITVRIGRGVSCTKTNNNPPHSYLRKPTNIWISGWVSKKCGDLGQANTMKTRKTAFQTNSFTKLKSLISIMHPPFDTHTPQPMNYGADPSDDIREMQPSCQWQIPIISSRN